MPREIDVNPGLLQDVVEQHGLFAGFFFEKHLDPGGKPRILPRGVILDRSGRTVSAVILRRGDEAVARCAPDLESPYVGQQFPGHPASGRCGYRIDFDLVADAATTYSLVADIAGIGQVEFARPVVYSWKGRLDVQFERQDHPDMIEAEFWDILPKVWGFTALETPRLYSLYSALAYVFRRDIPGDFVECGVFMGGCVMMMAEMCKRRDLAGTRRVFALDTFNGFPRVDDVLDVDVRTGEKMSNKPFKEFFERSATNMRSVGFDRLNIVRGDVLETIPTLDLTQIAILRLDTDTYDTTRFELEQLYDRVSGGGVVIIDDYAYTPGCRKAVDEFIADRPVFLQRVDWECRTWVKSETGGGQAA
jgi:O-methyltransferase